MSEELILVVEDDVISAEALREKLLSLDYRVPAAVTRGEEAVDRARALRPALILMDIKLAGAMDGVEAAERIQSFQDVPVLYLTAYTDEETLKRAKVTAPHGYLIKPVRDRELHITVEMALQRHRLERTLREQYERLTRLEKLKDDLVHMVVHDMRSPLTAILGSLEIAREGSGAEQTAARENLDVALRGAELLMSMINSLLDISRLEEGEMPLSVEECELLELAVAAVSAYLPLAHKKSIAASAAGERTSVRADAGLLRRVLDNLIGNAIKFTPPAGTITVRVSRRGREGRVEVSDDGPAIPAEYHGKIFEKFFHIEAEGRIKTYSSGLGLTFCRLALEAHHGRIGVESGPECGNTFWFALPLPESGL